MDESAAASAAGAHPDSPLHGLMVIIAGTIIWLRLIAGHLRGRVNMVFPSNREEDISLPQNSFRVV